MNPQPSADALKLAALINKSNTFHDDVCGGDDFCELCVANAQLLDRELQLPQRNAALFAAQGVCDIAQRGFDPYAVGKAIDELRDALAAIKTQP